MWIEVKLVISVITSAATIITLCKNVLKAMLKLLGYMAQVHEFTGPGRTLYLK